MALLAAVVLLGLVLKDDDLLALAVLDDLSLHRGALYNGSAEGSLVPVQDSQDLVKGHLVPGLVGQLLDEEGIALGHLVLLAAGLDNRVHHFQLLHYGLAVGGGDVYTSHLWAHSKRL